MRKISSIFEYSVSLLKKYNELLQIQEKNIYRIVAVKPSSLGQYKIIIQIIGKSSVIECSPQEIVSVDWLLEGFSKKDIRTIAYYAWELKTQPKYKIIAQAFCEKSGKMLFKLQTLENEKYIVKTANQIITDRSLINDLSKEDINSISYMAGYECSNNH